MAWIVPVPSDIFDLIISTNLPADETNAVSRHLLTYCHSLPVLRGDNNEMLLNIILFWFITVEMCV